MCASRSAESEQNGMNDALRPPDYLAVTEVYRTRRAMLLCWIVELVSVLAGVIGYEAMRVVFALMVMRVLVR